MKDKLRVGSRKEELDGIILSLLLAETLIMNEYNPISIVFIPHPFLLVHASLDNEHYHQRLHVNCNDVDSLSHIFIPPFRLFI